MDKKLVIRLAVLMLSIINTALTMMGQNPVPISDSVVYEAVSIIVIIAATAWSVYKNNNFTLASKVAQKVLDAMKSGKLTADRVEEFLTKP